MHLRYLLPHSLLVGSCGRRPRQALFPGLPLSQQLLGAVHVAGCQGRRQRQHLHRMSLGATGAQRPIQLVARVYQLLGGGREVAVANKVHGCFQKLQPAVVSSHPRIEAGGSVRQSRLFASAGEHAGRLGRLISIQAGHLKLYLLTCMLLLLLLLLLR